VENDETIDGQAEENPPALFYPFRGMFVCDSEHRQGVDYLDEQVEQVHSDAGDGHDAPRVPDHREEEQERCPDQSREGQRVVVEEHLGKRQATEFSLLTLANKVLVEAADLKLAPRPAYPLSVETVPINYWFKVDLRVVHEAGGLACYDQANANGILGITRAREAGFDLCHFNLHKTFSTPHACGGPGAGACGVSEKLIPFLPAPTVEKDGERFWLDHDRPRSVGKMRPWYGVAPNIVRAYAWIMSLGAEGLREVAEIAVLNNNYLLARVLAIRGVSAPYAEGKRRIEQVRYSWKGLADDTDVHFDHIGARMNDHGAHFWSSHHPFVVPEPMTLEPTESYSMDDLDQHAAMLNAVAEESYSDPDTVRSAPHRSTIHQVDHSWLDDPDQWAVTWRAYLRKHGEPVEDVAD